MLTESYLLINIHTYVHTYVHAYIHTYTHTYIRIHTHMYTHIVLHAEFRDQENLNTVCGTICKVHIIEQACLCGSISALHLGRFPVLN